MAGRKSKYTPDTCAIIEDTLGRGGTIRDACAAAGITKETFRVWRSKPAFSDLVTRAQYVARQRAVDAIKTWLDVSQTVTEIAEVNRETKLRKVKHPDGTFEEVPYTVERTQTRKVVTYNPPDWRAGVEYLKRRDRQHWSDRIEVKVDDWRLQAIEDIRAGRIPYAVLAEAFDDSLAEELFRAAGVPIVKD